MPKRTYVDSCVLIAACRGDERLSAKALSVIDDPDRKFVVSSYLELEVVPKPTFHKYPAQVQFMREFLAAAAERIDPSAATAADAIRLASKYDLSAFDALHASVARTAAVDELVTMEKPTKPLLAVKEVNVISLHAE